MRRVAFRKRLIILFKEGRIVGQGTFEELLHTDSYFMDLYNANVK